MTRILIKNTCILSMDPAVGDFDDADILIEDDWIVAVGPNLQADSAEIIDGKGRIVIPGLVNAHIHTWEFQLRGIGSDWVSSRDYHANMHKNLATRYEDEDVYIGNLVGSLNQLRNGTTTIVDWCHITRDASMTDAAIDGLEESGIRAVFARGTVKPPERPGEVPYHKKPFPREEIHRLRTGRLSSDDGLVTLAMAILGPDWGEYDVAAHDIRLAREYGLINSAHTYGRKGKRVVEDGYPRLAKEGLLGPDHNIGHGNCFDDEELKIVLDAGCTITATNLTEMLNYEQPAMLGRLVKHGAVPSLGTDCDPYFNSSMLAVTRHAFLHQRELDNRSLWHEGSWPAKTQHSTLTRDAIYWATMGGAKAFGLDRKIGSITPGKQADLVMFDCRGMNIFPALPGGNPAHIVVMYAETSDIENVIVAGRFAKRDGQLTLDPSRLQQLQDELLESRMRMFSAGNFKASPVERGPQPQEFFL
ncbi:amidohydrolase family protein [Hydrogenophaga laconesensis]|uniref:Cytosine/adenosine deaminase-related metal-dependent hydrolase n=1 Tax=Hydrogenophaga laconesensis TaxID=1805971 RepID=A0ABU1VBW4_9BURK|nr:amidohydrolase family protein [Hydrogenophaga laconesensis]MDR7094932.1 cytosine/adenosine deaminase-related metal-dependent hydrolase [Hydrogenophaga laconesensis]